MTEQNFKKRPYLIIGEYSALYYDCFTKETVTLKSPQDISQIKKHSLDASLDVYSDLPGASYNRYPFPKLSRFELKQALKNHPDLQDKKLLAASATLTENKERNLWRLTSTPLLLKWIEVLADHDILLNSLHSLPFQHAFSLPDIQTKVLYWISKTPDNRSRHVCLIKGIIVFVRYTPLRANNKNEIKETLHFIQRDYAVDCADITTLNQLEKEPILPKNKPQQHLCWLWLDHLPEKLHLAFQALIKRQRYYKGAKIFKIASLSLLLLSTTFFLKNSVYYYQARTHEKDLIEASKSLPEDVHKLSLRQLQKLLFLAQNSQTPSYAMTTLQGQNDPTFRLEEFHWRATTATQQRLNIAVRRQENVTQKDRADHLETLFKTPPKALPFDQYVDRFELTLTIGETNE